MHFYISFLLFNLIMCVISKDLFISSSLDEVDRCGVGLKFLTKVNNTGTMDYNIELNPFECCLAEYDDKCDILIITGGCKEDAPAVDPYNRRGQCTVYLDYRATTGDRTVKRKTIRIHFDTTIKPKDITDDLKICRHTDEDPLNDCKPVDCDLHYNGKKPYYNSKLKRCDDVPVCVGDDDEDLPRVIYNPALNICIKGRSVNNYDKRIIRELTHRKKKAKDIFIIENHKEVDEVNTQLHKNEKNKKPTNKIGIFDDDITIVNPKLSDFALYRYFVPNRYASTVLCVIIATQCCLICAMIYCMTKSCGCGRKKVIRQFFNSRHDASVTTPLICTSNIDTDTTDYQYVSESSNNIDNKIKCYKACQKERKQNIKLSMSDDILSKCINRRNWDRMPKSDTIPELKLEDTLTVENERKVENKKASQTKVNFDEQEKVQPEIVKSIVEKLECDNQHMVNMTSEKEIKCHSFNILCCSKPSSDSKKHIMSFKKNSPEPEKAAQVYFSNDSIDDLLSERGFKYTGENPSKYSFTSVSSDAKSSFSTRSSRTSKNNIVKNVLSIFSRKSKGPSSDPGMKKSKGKLNLELIHMSRASVCSSSNEECVKAMKRLKDSRSSL